MTTPPTQSTPHVAPADTPSPFRVWLAATRPQTLALSLAPVMLGTAFAIYHDSFDGVAALFALLVAVFIQIGTNIANDYFDFKKGADTADRLGPARVTQRGWLAPSTVARAAILFFALAFLAGLVLVYKAGWELLILGIVCILAGAWYTGGPAPLAYTGLSDIFVVIFFGPVAVLGTYYAQTKTLDTGAALASLTIGLMATAVLVVNNLRDQKTDRIANKRTLVVRFGQDFGHVEHTLCLTLPFVVIAVGGYMGLFPTRSLLTFLLMPLVALDIYRVRQKEGAALNAHLASAARLCALFSLLFSLALVSV